MRILFIGNADNPLLVDLALELRRLRSGLDIDIISERESRHPRAREAFGRILAPEGDGWMRTTRGLKFLWYVAKYRSLLRKAGGGYDVIHVFYLSAIWGALSSALRGQGKRLVVSLFGSDIYRSSRPLRIFQTRLLSEAHRVTAANDDTLNAAVRLVGLDRSRTTIVRFGLRPLEHIERLLDSGSRTDHKRSLGIDLERMVVAVGYNASPNQRHAAIIRALASMPAELRARVHLVVPMTIGGTAAYIAEVDQLLVRSGLSFRLFTTMMSDEELARLRLATDIMVQVQPTDQLAGAMQEHLAAGSVVITGAWLPYGVLRDAGVRFWTVPDLDGLSGALVAALRELPQRERECAGNTTPIMELSAWSRTAPRWSALYD